MIGFALNVAAFLFLAWVALFGVALLTLIPRTVWKVLGCFAGALLLLLLYAIVPDLVAQLVAVALMAALAWLICAGLDRLRARRP